MKILSSLYKPTLPKHFVGTARAAALKIFNLLAGVRDTGDPLKLLLLGPPGTSNTALADFFAAQLGAANLKPNFTPPAIPGECAGPAPCSGEESWQSRPRFP